MEAREKAQFRAIVDDIDRTPEVVEEALQMWDRADGTRTTGAVVHLLIASRFAWTWPEFADYLDFDQYKDRDDPESGARLVARVSSWERLHDRAPDEDKAAFSMLVWARALGSRGFYINPSDLFGGAERSTLMVFHEANAILYGLPRDFPWRKRAQ